MLYQEGQFQPNPLPKDVIQGKGSGSDPYALEQYYSEEGLREGSLKKSASADNSNEITEEAIGQLQDEVRQLRQEIERIKKESSAP